MEQKFSIAAASRSVKRGRDTIRKMMDKGDLSFELDAKGNRVIDGSELARVFPDFDPKHAKPRSKSKTKTQRSESSIDPSMQRLLDEISEANRREREQYLARIERLEKDKDQADESYQRSLRLLEDRTRQTDELRQQTNAWQESIAAMEEKQANNDRQLGKLRRMLHEERERNQPVWKKLFG